MTQPVHVFSWTSLAEWQRLPYQWFQFGSDAVRMRDSSAAYFERPHQIVMNLTEVVYHESVEQGCQTH